MGLITGGKFFIFQKIKTGNYNANPTLNQTFNLQKNTGYHQTDVLQKFYVPLSEKHELKLNIQYSKSSNIPRFDQISRINSSNR